MLILIIILWLFAQKNVLNINLAYTISGAIMFVKEITIYTDEYRSIIPA